MAGADNWLVFEDWKLTMANGVADCDDDTFKQQLHTSTYVPTLSGDAVRADLTDELPTANGYTAAGLTLSTTFTEAAGVVTLDASPNPIWTAAGGSIVARYGVLYDDTPAAPLDPLVCYTLLDDAPADVTATDTNTLTIQLSANGFYQISGGTTP